MREMKDLIQIFEKVRSECLRHTIVYPEADNVEDWLTVLYKRAEECPWMPKPRTPELENGSITIETEFFLMMLDPSKVQLDLILRANFTEFGTRINKRSSTFGEFYAERFNSDALFDDDQKWFWLGEWERQLYHTVRSRPCDELGAVIPVYWSLLEKVVRLADNINENIINDVLSDEWE